MLVSTIEYSAYLGRMAIGRVERGVVHLGDSVTLLPFESDKPIQRGRVSKLYGYEGLERIEIQEASAGEIVLLAWNEYLYAFLLLSKDQDVTLSVALGNFLSADDSPWELLMATGLIYALPPAAIYYSFKRYMVSGLTAGAVKS